MSVEVKDIAALVLNFLNVSIEKGLVSADGAESLNVAIECISDAFEVGKETIDSTIDEKFAGKNLLSLANGLSDITGAKAELKPLINKPMEVDENDKKLAETHKNEGNNAMRLKNYGAALIQYSKAIEIDPSNFAYYSNRSVANSMLLKYEEAVQDAEAAIQLNPTFSKAYTRLATAKLGLGKTEDAFQAYKKVLDLEGDNATDAMKKDLEDTRLLLEKSIVLGAKSSDSEKSDDKAKSKSFADIAAILGGSLQSIMGNPQLQMVAQELMRQNPEVKEQFDSVVQNPALREAAKSIVAGINEAAAANNNGNAKPAAEPANNP